MLSIYFNPDSRANDIRAAIDSFALSLNSASIIIFEGPIYCVPSNATLKIISSSPADPPEAPEHNASPVMVNPAVQLIHRGRTDQHAPNARHPFFVESPLRLEIILQTWIRQHPTANWNDATLHRWTWSQAFEPGQFYVDVTPVLTSRPSPSDAAEQVRRDQASR